MLIQVWALEQGEETALSRRAEGETLQQDVLVPWKRRDGAQQDARYYHLFKEGELAALVQQAGASILASEWVRGNWVIEACKK